MSEFPFPSRSSSTRIIRLFCRPAMVYMSRWKFQKFINLPPVFSDEFDSDIIFQWVEIFIFDKNAICSEVSGKFHIAFAVADDVGILQIVFALDIFCQKSRARFSGRSIFMLKCTIDENFRKIYSPRFPAFAL